MYVARRNSPPDWFDVHPQGTSQPRVSPLTINFSGFDECGGGVGVVVARVSQPAHDVASNTAHRLA
jgi:hypothetical protein